MNIQRKNSAHHFRMQSEREQTLVNIFSLFIYGSHFRQPITVDKNKQCQYRRISSYYM